MYLLRVKLPDRPGALGGVATALGAAHADIHAVEIVERGDGYAIDDFMLTMPANGRPDELVSACARLAGVEVLWVSLYPENWGLAGDLDVLEEMLAAPHRAERVLADHAPATFHSSWALVLDRADGRLVHRSDLAPGADQPLQHGVFGDLGTPHVAQLGAGWFDGWGDHAVAVAPFGDGHAIVVGRTGPEFRRSELLRLRHLALLASDHDAVHLT